MHCLQFLCNYNISDDDFSTYMKSEGQPRLSPKFYWLPLTLRRNTIGYVAPR